MVVTDEHMSLHDFPPLQSRGMAAVCLLVDDRPMQADVAISWSSPKLPMTCVQTTVKIELKQLFTSKNLGISSY